MSQGEISNTREMVALLHYLAAGMSQQAGYIKEMLPRYESGEMLNTYEIAVLPLWTNVQPQAVVQATDPRAALARFAREHGIVGRIEDDEDHKVVLNGDRLVYAARPRTPAPPRRRVIYPVPLQPSGEEVALAYVDVPADLTRDEAEHIKEMLAALVAAVESEQS